MSHPTPDSTPESTQSPGCDPKTKRNSGLFSFFKWFKPSNSRESIDSDDSSSCDSLTSVHSTGTVASFSYVPPSAYPHKTIEKTINTGPETDTYKARLKQRDKRRENDKNLTLRKKYNLFFSRDTLFKRKPREEEENTRSLPLMTRTSLMEDEEDERAQRHRRTNSESSKTRKSGAYLHVKGKRRAPQPPNQSTLSLRRKKRIAPSPPLKIIMKSEEANCSNDSLKLEFGVLKPIIKPEVSATTSKQNGNTPISPRPWYKRNPSHQNKKEHKYEVVERLPEVPFARNSIIDLSSVGEDVKKKDEKRKSGMSFLTNISELDREASEIVKQQHKHDPNISEIPPFMRPKDSTPGSWVSPKRRSAKDLIAKFNAITNVTKVTVNTALFGGSPGNKRNETKQENLLQNHKKKLESLEQRTKPPLMKSESTSAIIKEVTPKNERKNWNCPKCNLENDYWRIICHVCSTIKPYFDDFTPSAPKDTKVDNRKSDLLNLERSKTQIGFSALATYGLNNGNKAKKIEKSISLEEKSESKRNEERERLKQMLIEMKNSLPKRKSNILMKQNSRTSVIVENCENETPETSKTDTGAKKSEDYEKESRGNIKTTVVMHHQPTEVKKSHLGSSCVGNNGTKTSSEPFGLLKKQISKEDSQTGGYEVIEVAEKKSLDAATKGAKPLPGDARKVGSEAPPGDARRVGLEAPPGDARQLVAVPKASARAVITTTTTIYENVKIKKPLEPPEPKKPQNVDRKSNFELMKLQDFEDIYAGDSNSQSAARIYANLARNDELSLFFNMPRRFSQIKNNLEQSDTTKDTIQINRLLRKLESSIAKGELTESASYAKELAQLKINCSVVRQKAASDGIKKKEGFT